MEFTTVNPSNETYWRSIVLYGQNVACYKFALAQSLLELAPEGKTLVTLEELAVPFSRYIIEHLKVEDRQTTSSSSRFLDACRQFNTNEISLSQLIDSTVQLGFQNVIDAFHNVNGGEIPTRFFIDERRGSTKGIVLTDNLLRLLESYQFQSLPQEVEARWRLVETAWKLKISRSLISVKYDHERELLFAHQGEHHRRVDVTSCRDALNGYQRGKCFYCFADISLKNGSDDLADVDHFFPRVLVNHDIPYSIDGVWNLVLACQRCNRGQGGKFAHLPHRHYLNKLYIRNEHFIRSHHPLRETLIQQTGNSLRKRQRFLGEIYKSAASGRLINTSWQPEFE